MRTFLPFCFLLFFVTANAQESITLKFVRPSSTKGSTDKIQISIQNNDYILKDGGNISINVTPDFAKSLKIECSVLSGPQTNYFLDPLPNQIYEFEVGLRVNGIYIKLTSGQEVNLGGIVQQVDNDNVQDNNLKVNRNNKDIGLVEEKPREPETTNEKWLRYGGKVQYASLMLTTIYARVDKGKFGAMNAAGAGYSAGKNFMNIKMPEKKSGPANWNSFNWGLGLDLNMYALEFNTIYKSSGLTTTNNYSFITLNIIAVGNVGWTWGFGKFVNENNWKGMAFTVKYRPTFSNSFTMKTVTTSTSNPLIDAKKSTSDNTEKLFNYAGIGCDLDFLNYSITGKKISQKPRFKVSLFIGPPVGDNPLVLSLSYGLTIYSRKR